MSNFSITEQLKQRKLRLTNGSNQTQNDHGQVYDDKKESNHQSKEQEIIFLKNQIKQKQTQINQLQNEMNALNQRLSQLTSNQNENQNLTSNSTQNQNQPQNLNQSQNQNQNQNQNHSELNQEALDHEIAMQLQRNFDNEANEHHSIHNNPHNHNHNHNPNNNPNPNASHQTFSFQSQTTFQPNPVFQHMNEIMSNMNQMHSSSFGSPFFSIQTSRRYIPNNNNDNNNNNHNNNDNIHHPMNNLFRNLFAIHGNSVDIDQMTFTELSNLFPTIPRGANQETINNLPTESFKSNEPKKNKEKEEEQKEDMNNDNNNNKKKEKLETCSICLEEFKDGDTIRRLPCFHIFHKNEIDRWLRTNHVCPICRSPIEQNQ